MTTQSTPEAALVPPGRSASATTALSTRLADAASARPPTLRSRVTNNPAYIAGAATSQRAQNRRRRDLVRILIQAIGPEAGDLALVTVRKAAELTVAAEAARARVLNGGTCAADLDMLVKLEGEARRAIRALGLKPLDAKRVEAPPQRPWSPLMARITAPLPPAKPEVAK
jgi:hypothetical protein